MPRQLTGKVVIATHNAGKLREMQELLAPFGVEAVSAGDLGLPSPDETGHMFAENAAIKAHAAAKATGLPALSDDSGLCVEALDGAPGLFTADWVGPNKDFMAGMSRVERELRKRHVPDDPASRRAHFVSALVIAWPDGHEELYEGRVHGQVIWPPRGEKGFGYDPMFQPEGFDETFGEMPSETKHGVDWVKDGAKALSHRARAFVKLAEGSLKRA
ncbi:non-canonical purine NTP pyrophosphatase [Microvirga pudoricolor]|uniref:non-canonical purine NTP pyrophosphatase n=1 Tax=Microvirga pudoricolor TaxID=2778729 RepID=UPI001951AC2C|nr:non-canonical purine NTP pyrophosphatase [Microvirga pudoricolor]MBM6594995.1 non-canonical purine NTP pyrophosphatase [Microvirga pudoricolor]